MKTAKHANPLMPILLVSALLFNVNASRGQETLAPSAIDFTPSGDQLKAFSETFAAQLAQLRPMEIREAVERVPIGTMSHLSIKDTADPGVEFATGAEAFTTLQELPPERQNLERIIGVGSPDFVPAVYLSEGANRAKPVARVILTRFHQGLFPGSGWGTGFLVASDILMTNNHVIPTASFAKDFTDVQFNFQMNFDGTLAESDVYAFDPDDFFYTNKLLDFTLVRVKSKSPGDGEPSVSPGELWGVIPVPEEVVFVKDIRVNIIQHPDGRPKEVALHNNTIKKLFSNVVHYTTDTEPGSSGSPVLDNTWTLMALHHAAGEKQNGVWISNEGIRIDKIVEDIRNNVRNDILTLLGLRSTAPQ